MSRHYSPHLELFPHAPGTSLPAIDSLSLCPCKRLRPRLEQLAREQKGEVIIYSIDAEKAVELSRRIGIRAFPTLLFIPVEGTPTLSEGLLSLKDLRQQADKIKGVASR